MAFGYIPPKKLKTFRGKVQQFLSDFGIRVEGQNNLLKRIQVPATKKLLSLDSNDEVLELGAGSCAYAYEFSKKVSKYVATDIEDLTEWFTTRELPVSLSFRCCDAHELPFRDEEFNKIFISEVIPVLKDPTKALQEVYRVLRSDGVVVLVNGGQYLHIQKFYESNNIFIRLIRNKGVRNKTIPRTYSEYHRKLTEIHGTKSDYFTDRESYIKERVSEAGFNVIDEKYSVRKYSNYMYQLLCFFNVCINGSKTFTVPPRYIYILPFLKLLDIAMPRGKGMAYFIVLKK